VQLAKVVLTHLARTPFLAMAISLARRRHAAAPITHLVPWK